MPRLEALRTEWKRNPPVALMVKAFLGIKDTQESAGDPILPGFMTQPDIED